ncbi:MAG: Do family serine endopeptidase [Planctomycetota bacterium]|jgi:serine protease Do
MSKSDVGLSKGMLSRVLFSFVLIGLLLPTVVFSQDTDSIKALRNMGKAFAQIAEKTSPAVVGIKAEQVFERQGSSRFESPFGDPFDDDFFERFFGMPSPRRREREPERQEFTRPVQGSGFIISSDGYVLTNNHIVRKAENIQVILEDGRELDAEIIGTDPDSDVALIKVEVDEEELPYLELADSDKLEVGEWVLAIGNPFGLSHTVTAGIVSAKGRSGIGLAAYEDFIQTDAAINPGNSGGPLINLNGEVVGMNTAIVGAMGNIGIGLAIPINMAKSVRQQLVDTGTVTRGFLGIMGEDITPEKAEMFNLEEVQGIAITQVVEDSPAEKAGLKLYDVIVEFEGEPVANYNEFRNKVAMIQPGTEIELAVLRDGEHEKIVAELGERPNELAGQGRGAGRDEPGIVEQLGFKVQELTDELAHAYDTLSGVIVSNVEQGSEAQRKGMRIGMLIQEVNRKKVTSIKEFNEAIKEAGEQDKVLLLVYNGSYNQFIVLNIPKDEE